MEVVDGLTPITEGDRRTEMSRLPTPWMTLPGRKAHPGDQGPAMRTGALSGLLRGQAEAREEVPSGAEEAF